MRGWYRGCPHTDDPTCTATCIIINIPTRWYIYYNDEPTVTHHYHPKSLVNSGVHSTGLDTCTVMTATIIKLLFIPLTWQVCSCFSSLHLMFLLCKKSVPELSMGGYIWQLDPRSNVMSTGSPSVVLQTWAPARLKHTHSHNCGHLSLSVSPASVIEALGTPL